MPQLKVLSLFLLSAVMFLVACSSTANKPTTEEKSTVVRAPIEGIWNGEFDIGGKGPYDFTVIHLDGNAYAYSLKAKAMCIGTAKYDGENFISRYVLFALDGGPFDWATITGKLKTETTLATHFVTSSGGDTGALSMTYNPIYESPSSLKLVQGNWGFTDRDDLTTKFVITEDGTITGNDTDSCDYLGYVEVISPKYNAYQIKVEASNCDSVNGEYEGIAFLEEQKFILQMANEKYSLFFGFERES